MILWCAYCQKYLGEREPFDNYSLSHGICSFCTVRGLDIPEQAFARINKLKKIQENIWQLGSKIDIDGARKLAKECFDFGVRPADFVMGFVSPFLGQLTLKQDYELDQLILLHEFCQELLVYSRQQLPNAERNINPDVLITVGPGSKHFFDVQFLEMWLTAEGIRAHALIDQKTEYEILDYCIKIQPKVIVFSISDADRSCSLVSLIEKLKSELDVPPLLVAGGHAVKYNLIDKKQLKGLSLIKDEAKLFLLIKSHLSLGFLYDLAKDKTGKKS